MIVNTSTGQTLTTEEAIAETWCGFASEGERFEASDEMRRADDLIEMLVQERDHLEHELAAARRFIAAHAHCRVT